MTTRDRRSYHVRRDQHPRHLITRYLRQLDRASNRAGAAAHGTFALTFLPGDYTASFLGKTLRPLGSTVAVVLTTGNADCPSSVAGFRARLHADGSVAYGLQRDIEFRHAYDLHSRSGNGLNPFRNPSLFETAIRLNASCQHAAKKQLSLRTRPLFPRIWLSFAPDRPPEFVDTPGLRRHAAAMIGIPAARLAQNPAKLVERLLRQTWEAALRAPGTTGNPTELWLADAELCAPSHRPLKAWEDFSELVAAKTWNPVRAVKVFSVPNPAREVLLAQGFDPKSPLSPQVTSDDLLDALEAAVRNALGDTASGFSAEDLYDGLLAPDEELWAITESLPALRRKLAPYWSECVTDQDLRDAALRPLEPLAASGACRVQVLRQRDIAESLYFPAESLARRITADWSCEYFPQLASPALKGAAQ